MVPRSALLTVALVAGCGSTPDARVVQGGQNAAAIRAEMQHGGVVFAPYMELPALGSEATDQHYRCITAVNKAVGTRLAARYAIRPSSDSVDPRTRRPFWVLGPAGPRVAVHIETFRCGRVLGEPTFVSAKSFAEEPGSEGAGEVLVTVHDRTTGAPIMQIKGEARAGDGPSAVDLAGAAAIEQLVPPVE